MKAKTGVDRADSAWVAAALTAVLEARRIGGAPCIAAPPTIGVVDAAIQHRVVPLLAPHGADLGLSEMQRERLHQIHVRLSKSGLANVAHTAAASAALRAAGLDHLVVKGVVLPALLGQSPHVRGPGDVDIWIRPQDWPDAEHVLESVGWSRRAECKDLPQPGETWRGRIVKTVGMEMPFNHPQRSSVDLHWRLVPDHREIPFGFDEALARSVPIPAVGEGIRTLCPVDALHHIAQHGRKEHWPVLRQLVDVIDLAEACQDNLDELARTNPNIRCALATAAHLDPQLGEVPSLSRRDRKLGAEAWQQCLSLQWPLSRLRSARGVERVRIRTQREWWNLRSAPTVSVAAAHIGRTVVPMRLLTDPHPIRHRRHRSTD